MAGLVAILTRRPPLAAGAWLGWYGVTYATARFFYKRVVRTRDAQLQNIMRLVVMWAQERHVRSLSVFSSIPAP